MNIEQYPCNRGNISTLNRGYHQYIYSNGKVICSLCGAISPNQLMNEITNGTR